MKTIDYVAIWFSVIVIAGGAVNTGVTMYVLAVPSMLYLLYMSFVHKKILIPFVIIYSLVAIFISVNRDTNHFIYPIIKDGVVTIRQDLFLDVGSKKFIAYTDFFKYGRRDKINDPEVMAFLNDPTVKDFSLDGYHLRKISTGETFKVLGFRHDYSGLQNYIDVETEIGYIHNAQYDPVGRYSFNKNIVAPWVVPLEYSLWVVVYMLGLAPFYLLVNDVIKFFKKRKTEKLAGEK